MRIKHVQNVHNYEKLQKSYTDLLKGRDRALSLNLRNNKNNINRSLLNSNINYAIQKHYNAVKSSRKNFTEKSLIV